MIALYHWKISLKHIHCEFLLRFFVFNKYKHGTISLWSVQHLNLYHVYRWWRMGLNLYTLLIYQPYKCIEIMNFITNIQLKNGSYSSRTSVPGLYIGSNSHPCAIITLSIAKMHILAIKNVVSAILNAGFFVSSRLQSGLPPIWWVTLSHISGMQSCSSCIWIKHQL